MDKERRTRMGSIYRGGKWYADFTIDGKRFRPRIDASSKREANNKSIIEKNKKLAEFAKTKSDIPFSEALQKFLTQYCGYVFMPNGDRKFVKRSIKESTADRYWTSSKMLGPYFMGRYLKSISKLDIVDYIECRRKGTTNIKPCSDATIIRDLRMLSKLITFISNQTDWDGANVVTSFDKKYLKDSETRIRSLDTTQKKTLLAMAKKSKNPNLYYEIKFAYLTGLRWNEQFSLLRTDFERTNFGPQIIIRNKNTKNGKNRVVPLCDEALEIVEVLLKKPASLHGYLFYNPDTGDRVNSNRSSWLTCLEKSNITDFRWHDLRHTYATDEIKKGMPIYTLSKLMGHANVAITEKYAHLYTEDLHEAKRKVDTKLDTHIGLSAVSN